MSWPAGTQLMCPDCATPLYEFTETIHYGGVVEASKMRRVNGVEEAVPGAMISCPTHGPLRCGNTIPTWLLAVPE